MIKKKQQTGQVFVQLQDIYEELEKVVAEKNLNYKMKTQILLTVLTGELFSPLSPPAPCPRRPELADIKKPLPPARNRSLRALPQKASPGFSRWAALPNRLQDMSPPDWPAHLGGET